MTSGDKHRPDVDASPVIETRKLSSLKPAPYNPRRIDAASMAALEKSIERFGLVQPIIVNKAGRVVGGHQRLKALKSKKVTETTVVVVDLSEDDEKALNVALNSPTLEGEFTADLAGLLDEIEAANAQLFAELRLGDLRDGIEEKPPLPEDIDDVPELPGEPVTKLGDVWVLGRHRLICGDSTDPAVSDNLLGVERVDLCFTSPPYNAGKSEALSGNTNTTDNKYQDGYNDDRSKGDYLGLLRAFSSEALRVSRCVCVNIQQLAGNKVAFIDWLHEFRRHIIDISVWDKGHAAPQIATGVMANRFEYLVWLSPDDMPSRSMPGATFQGTVHNVYEGPPQRKNEFAKVHAATFPVHLPHWAIETFTADCSIILDPFAGTGTTLVACETSHRKARLVEIDPAYCDVIVKRWEGISGGQAVLEARGQEL